MDLFLLHSLILIWASLGAARRLTRRVTDQFLTGALLGWGNLVATGLLLASCRRLGEPAWFFGSSVLIAVLTFLLVRLVPEIIREFDALKAVHLPNPWLSGVFLLTLIPLACATLAVACVFEPTQIDALEYQLPRALYYLGQGSLAHFDAADLRQIYLPFNHTLLQLAGLVYGAPLQCLNFFNVAGWVVSGLAVYRLCRLSACSVNASLITCWLALVAPPVIAQAAAVTPDLPAGAALLCVFVFALHWQQTLRSRDALLAGLALGLAAGSDWGVTAFVLAAGLPLLVWCHRSGQAAGRPGLRAWILPTLLAAALGLPFVLLNLTGAGHAAGPVLGVFFHRPEGTATAGAWPGFLSLLGQLPSLLTTSEDNIGFGPVALLFLVALALGLRHPRKFSGGFAGLGAGWIVIQFVLHRGSLPHPRELVPGFLLLGPCVALVIDHLPAAGRIGRHASQTLLLAVALATGGLAGIYLFANGSRPLESLLDANLRPPTPPALPGAFEYYLSRQPRINIDTDATHERIFPFLTMGRNQRFSSRQAADPDAYNLISRLTRSHNAGFRDLTEQPSYTLIHIQAKRTAGVEFLATVGTGPEARDYYNQKAQSGKASPPDTTRTLLVTLSPAPASPTDPLTANLKLEGLNPADRARLEVSLRFAGGNVVPLTTIADDGDTTLTIPRPFDWMLFHVRDVDTGADLGSSAIPYLGSASVPVHQAGRSHPSSSSSVFVKDVVLAPNPSPVSVEGLLPAEGPFPQWDLPFLRWARQPSVRLTLPPIARLSRLQLSFSVRLHVRNKAALDVFFNGRLVHHYRLMNRTAWVDETLDLIPRPGENVLEFRDGSIENKPDWLDYLERYPDVKQYLVAQHLPLEQGAREHYEKAGRAEGRTVHLLASPEPAPDSYYFMFRHIRLEGFRSP